MHICVNMDSDWRVSLCLGSDTALRAERGSSSHLFPLQLQQEGEIHRERAEIRASRAVAYLPMHGHHPVSNPGLPSKI